MDNFWKNKNVLITGINGFVGSAVAHRLLQQGAKITGVVRNLNGDHGGLLAYCNILVGDICDFDFLREVISSNEIDVIFHFAAYSIVRISSRDPMSTYRVNIMGTVALLEAARQVGRCSSIVVASSDKAYGDNDQLPYKETHPLIPKNTYDTSKGCMDLISQSYALNYGMPICITRCSNIYGPGDYNFSRIIPNTIRRALKGEAPLLYSDIESMEREFVYIDDVAEAYDGIGRLDHSEGQWHGKAFNIGGLGPTNINDLSRLICEKVGRPELEPIIVQREPQFKEIKRQYIDSSRLTKVTGWLPRTLLPEGIEKSIRWYKEFP